MNFLPPKRSGYFHELCGLCGGGSGNLGLVPSRQAQLFLPPLVMNKNTEEKKKSFLAQGHPGCGGLR